MPFSVRMLAWKRRLYGPLGLTAAFLAGAVLAGTLTVLFAGLAHPPPARTTQGAGGSPDLDLILTPGLLTAIVQQSIAAGESPIPFRQAQVTTAAGRLTVAGDISVLGQPVPASIDFRPELQSGHLAMQVTGAHLDAIPLPRDVGGLAEGPINRALAAATSGLPATLVSVTAAPDGLEVVARLTPGALPTRPEPATAAHPRSSHTPVQTARQHRNPTILLPPSPVGQRRCACRVIPHPVPAAALNHEEEGMKRCAGV